MAKAKGEAFEIECPCCEAKLKVDPTVRAVLTFKAKEKPRSLDDISTGVERLKGEQARREEAFERSFQQMKSSKDVLAAKFDELLKKAQEDPDSPPPKPLGFD
jgi:uncharacterized protein YndB with AHSA1/START domain